MEIREKYREVLIKIAELEREKNSALESFQLRRSDLWSEFQNISIEKKWS